MCCTTAIGSGNVAGRSLNTTVSALNPPADDAMVTIWNIAAAHATTSLPHSAQRTQNCRHDLMSHRDVVVVGASSGGVDVLSRLAAGLPEDLPAAVFVVLHVRADAPSQLPAILNRAGPLPAAHAVDREPIRRGRIYIAP